MMESYSMRLFNFYDREFGKYDDEIAWYPNPAPNQWKFKVPSLNELVVLTCSEGGNVTQEVSNIK